jgi:hypothetical protein
MRQSIVFGLMAVTAIGSAAALLGPQALAQGAPPSPAAPPHPGMERPGPERPFMERGGMGGPGGWMHGPGAGDMHGPGGMMRRMMQFALIYPAPDRALSGPDVQKIAEAFLLFNGNHTWKITEVTEEPNRVTFAIATPDGTAIAHFAMNRHTGRPQRLS